MEKNNAQTNQEEVQLICNDAIYMADQIWIFV